EGNSVEHRMRPARIERVPPHMRDLQISVRGRNPLDVAWDPAQSLRHLVFAAALGHELHADANAEDGTAALAHALVDRLHHAVDARGATLPDDLSIQALPTHASKNRRSADSRSSPTTMPTFVQPRRDSVKRRMVAASKPTRSDRSALAMIVTVADAPIKRNPTS